MYRDPNFLKAINEHMDNTDTSTRKIMLALDENGQSEALLSLTSKLYDKIVEKVDDIDFGDIPQTRGDIEKLPNFDSIVDCLDILGNLLKEYKQPTDSIDVITEALENVRSRRDIFMKAYTYNLELPMVIYNTTCLSIISAISLTIATSVEYIKTPGSDSYQITLDKVGHYKSKDYMLFNDLKKFNKLSKTGELDKAINFIIGTKVKNFTGVSIGVFAGSIAAITLIFNIIPIIREMVFFFYYSRTKISDYFDMQANLLQLNAYNIQANESLEKPKRDEIAKKQFKLVEIFRSISNKICVKIKSADVSASKELVVDNKRYKAEDILESLPDSAASSLF